MPTREPVGAICPPSKSGSGDNNGLEFVRCVDGLHPEIHEVWNFGEDQITPEVHPFAHVDIGAFIGDGFSTNYITKNGIRLPMFGKKQ